MTEQNNYFPRQRKISECASCSDRTMCVSDDGGIIFNCNRCVVAYGVQRGKFYDDAESQKPIIAGDTMHSVEAPKEQEKSKSEVKIDDKPKPTRKKTA